jgi:hypothetical protein
MSAGACGVAPRRLHPIPFFVWSTRQMDNPFLIFVIILALVIFNLFDFVLATG